MKLSARLSTILTMIPAGVACDVGSDHGKLIISLKEQKIISKGYAIENKKGPYTRLVSAIDEAKMNEEIIPLLSDGISYLPNDVDIVIIAGMGGNLIVDILKSHPENLKNVKHIVIDAHNATDLVRREVINLGYFIKNEKMVFEDDIYYEIIAFEKGNSKPLDDDDYRYGPFLRKEKSEIFINKYKQEIVKITKLLDNENLPKARKEELLQEKERMESIL